MSFHFILLFLQIIIKICENMKIFLHKNLEKRLHFFFFKFYRTIKYFTYIKFKRLHLEQRKQFFK